MRMFDRETPVQAPAAMPVTLETAKQHLCVQQLTEDDELISGYIDAAARYVESYTGRALITQTRLAVAEGFDGQMRLPAAPAQAVSRLRYYAADGTPAECSAYFLAQDGLHGLLLPTQSWPDTQTRPDAVQAEYVCGYGDALEAVPSPLRHAILLLIGHWYLNREAIANQTANELPFAVRALLAPFRVLEAF